MVKQIISLVWLGDWFVSVDIKDPYFHIQIAPCHRHLLRFAFKGRSTLSSHKHMLINHLQCLGLTISFQKGRLQNAQSIPFSEHEY